MSYDDDSATCDETYATLRVFSGELDPSEISELFGVEPSRTFKKGEIRSDHPTVTNPYYSSHGWIFSTRGKMTSRDCRRHIDMVVNAVLRNDAALTALRRRGCRLDVVIFYSYTGGGPTLSPQQMTALARAGVDVWWDLYRSDSDFEDMWTGDQIDYVKSHMASWLERMEQDAARERPWDEVKAELRWVIEALFQR